MNIQLHRKQVIMLVLAMLLAIASYWIPLPQQSGSPGEPQKLSDPVDRPKGMEELAFARESATLWRFPITVAIPRTMQPDPVVRSEEPRLTSAWATRQWIDVLEIGHDETRRRGNPEFVPTRDRERSLP